MAFNVIKIKEACLGGYRDGYLNPYQIIYFSAGEEPGTTVIETASRNIFLEMNVEEVADLLKKINFHSIWTKG